MQDEGLLRMHCLTDNTALRSRQALGQATHATQKDVLAMVPIASELLHTGG